MANRAGRLITVLVAVNLLALLAAAVWLRVASLDAIPAHSPDEAFYGIQTARLLRGQPAQARTLSGNIADPFFLALQAPMLWLAGPSVFVLRAPAVVSGLLSVALTLVLGRRALSSEEARIAALFLAALPASVVLSRFGCEFSQTPLAGIIVAYFALRGRPIGLLIAFLASLLVHPTNVFLVPIFLPGYLVRRLGGASGDRRRQVRIVLGTALALALVLGPFSWWMLRNPAVQRYFGQGRDWAMFLDGFGRFLFCLWLPATERAILWYRWLFRGAWLVLLGLGLPRLVGSRSWERVALVVGLPAGLVAFHFLSSSGIFDSFEKRYGMVFLVPTALVFGILLRSIVPDPAAAGRPLMRWAWLAPVLVISWASVVALKVNYFDMFAGNGRESIWALRSGDSFDLAFRLIREDRKRHPRAGIASHLVLAQDVHNTMQLEYLASRQDSIKVAGLIDLGDIWLRSVDPNGFEPKRRKLCELLELGAYAVGVAGGKAEHGGDFINETIRSKFPPERVRRWDIPEHGGRALTVYRLVESRDANVAKRESNPRR